VDFKDFEWLQKTLMDFRYEVLVVSPLNSQNHEYIPILYILNQQVTQR